MKLKNLVILFMILILLLIPTRVFAEEQKYTVEENSENSGEKITSGDLVVNEEISKDRVKELKEGNKEENKKKYKISTIATSQKLENTPIEYKNTTTVMTQYVTKDASKTKILNKNVLYTCNISTGMTSTEYTFPVSESISGGNFYGTQYKTSAYIDETNGILYYAYNEFSNTYSEKENIKIVVYDLEKASVKNTYTVSGHIMESVGCDKSGRIYIGTDDYILDSNKKDYVNKSYLIVLSSNGSKQLAEQEISDPINSFSGFTNDGKFFFIDEFMKYSAYGYENLIGRLRIGTFKNNKISINEKAIMDVKNIYFGDYNTPVEVVNDEYLVTFNGVFIPISSITDSSYSQKLYTPKNLEMGSQYDYIYNVGVNTIIDGNNVYTLNDNKTIFVYDLNKGTKLKMYTTNRKIFNMKSCGNDILLLETDGSKFYVEKISKSKFTTIKTKRVSMNTFSVYKDRPKNEIVKRFILSQPSNYSGTLFLSNSSEKKPYKESKLTEAAQTNAMNVSNYYRWLAGLTTFEKSSSSVWTKAAKGAVLLAASSFDHEPGKPANMTDAFYKDAYEGTSNSSIAYNYYNNQYKFIGTIRQLMDDLGYSMPGHRNNFLTRNGTKIAYGISSNYVCQTVEYKNDPNPQGTAAVNNNEAAYSWPPAGYCPAEEINKSAYWSVNLNTDKINLSNVALKVTIEDTATGKKWVRQTAADGLSSTSFWGKFISFAPPEISEKNYAGKRYLVTLSNLADEKGLPVDLAYIVNFFSYNGTFTIGGNKYKCNEYGVVTPKKVTGLKTKTQTTTSITPTWSKVSGAAGYELWKYDTSTKKWTCVATTTKNAYKVSKLKTGTTYKFRVRAYTKVGNKKKYGEYSSYLTSTTKPETAKISSGSSSKSSATLKWKKVTGASGYQILISSSKNGKYTYKKTVSGGSNLKGTISGLSKGKTYYFKVRAYITVNGKKVLGTGSSAKAVKIK